MSAPMAQGREANIRSVGEGRPTQMRYGRRGYGPRGGMSQLKKSRFRFHSPSAARTQTTMYFAAARTEPSAALTVKRPISCARSLDSTTSETST